MFRTVPTEQWREVGPRGLLVGPFGFGAAALGGLYEVVDPAVAEATVHRAVDLGIGLIDVAPHYGVGLAEQRLGDALATLPVDAVPPVLSTKVGRVLVDGADPGTIFAEQAARHSAHDLSEGALRASLEGSLQRLGRDSVGLCFLHDPDDHQDEALATAFPAMVRMRDEGLVAAIGAGMNQAEALERFVREGDLDVVLLAGRWTLLEHAEPARRLLDLCAARGVAVVLGGVLNSGVLAGGDRHDYVPAPPALLKRRDRLARVCADHDVDLADAAIAFGLGHPAVATVLVGARSADEVEVAAQAIRNSPPADLWDDLRDRGLLDDEVVTPT